MPSYLSAAPDSVLDAIFVYCDYGELFASSHTCTAWRRRTASSVLWRRVAQADLDRARGTEYQVVATPVQKRVGLTSSFNTAHLYTVEVRTRHRQRDGATDDGSHYSTRDSSGYGYSQTSATVPSYAQNLQMYTFGAPDTSAIATAVSRAYGGTSDSNRGGGGGALERNPSSTCFTTLGSTAKVRRVCVRYIKPLRFTAGDVVAAALRRATAAATTNATRADDEDGEAEKPLFLPLWEDGSILRPGVLVCDAHDPCTFCYYASTLHRPWCTVAMDQFIIDDELLVDFIAHSRDAGGSGGDAAATCIDLAFRVEELPVVRNDPRDPSHLVKPSQPVSIRIGVIEAGQLPAYQRGLKQIVQGMTFYSTADSASGGDVDDDDDSAVKASDNSSLFNAESRHNDGVVNSTAQDYAWGALDAGSGGRAGVSWNYTGGGTRHGDREDDADSAAAAEAEVSAWLQASVQESLRATQPSTTASKPSPSVPAKPMEFWSQTPDTRPTRWSKEPAADPYTSRRSSDARSRRLTDSHAAPDDDNADCAYVLGDTPGSFGYDTEGGYISEASSYPLGAPLQKGDVVHLQFFHDEDVIVVMRNRERLGTLVADAFSERQRWCVAVSLQNCGVRFIPPRLN